MLVIKSYKFQNGFDGHNAVIVINELNITVNSHRSLIHDREEETSFTVSGNENVNLQITASIYKDEAAYNAGAVAVEPLQFKTLTMPEDDHVNFVSALNVTFNESLDNQQAVEKAYQAIKENRADLFATEE